MLYSPTEHTEGLTVPPRPPVLFNFPIFIQNAESSDCSSEPKSLGKFKSQVFTLN